MKLSTLVATYEKTEICGVKNPEFFLDYVFDGLPIQNTEPFFKDYLEERGVALRDIEAYGDITFEVYCSNPDEITRTAAVLDSAMEDFINEYGLKKMARVYNKFNEYRDSLRYGDLQDAGIDYHHKVERVFNYLRDRHLRKYKNMV